MRPVLGLMTASLALSLGLLAQEDSPRPQVSRDPLSSEQVAIYNAVLEYYVKDGAAGVLNVGNTTEALEESEFWYHEKCFKGFDPPAKSSVSLVHRLDVSLILDQRFLFVDPDSQRKKIEENDPQRLIRRAIDGHEKVTDEQIGDAVKKAFGTGLFQLSEVRFDKQRRRALVAYSFGCGDLCGNGALLILKNAKGGWNVSKVCAHWVS